MNDQAPTQRLDPYVLVFGEGMDDRLFPPIAEEAEARDQTLDDPDRFLFLSSVGQLLQAIAGGEGYDDDDNVAGDPAAGEAPAGGAGAQGDPAEVAEPDAPADDDAAEGPSDAVRQYGRLLYHAFHYWRGGKRSAGLSEEALRTLVDEVTTVGSWSLGPPASTGYLRLPPNLVWAEPAPGLTPEPVDGFFWRLVDPEDRPARLHVLLVLGVRADRAGFSVIPATGVLDDEVHWAELDARPDGTDFETTLPGGEMDHLYSVVTPAEVLKLASLAFWHLDPR